MEKTSVSGISVIALPPPKLTIDTGDMSIELLFSFKSLEKIVTFKGPGDLPRFIQELFKKKTTKKQKQALLT